MFGSGNSMSIVAMEQSMTQDFLDGVIIAMLPSLFMVAWLVWRASGEQPSDFRPD
jgi:hypothetical protein